MVVETNTVAALLEKLKVDDPWLPPKPWESIPSESGRHQNHLPSHSQSSHGPYQISNLSEASLVRLVLTALQGVESALIAVDQLSALFSSDAADRTSHRISSLWTRSSSTRSLGNLLMSIGKFGFIVFLLQKFVVHFSCLNPDGDSGSDETPNEDNEEHKAQSKNNCSVVNHAFAVAVKKILDGYISALNTVYASVSLRRTLNNCDGGCLTDVGNAEITVLEVYLHTKGLRTQIEALGNICQICHIAHSFSVSSFEALTVKAKLEFTNFPRGGTLLSYLYAQLKVVDPVQFFLLRFLFLQAFEPYYNFIRSWIYGGRMNDPYKEFVMEYVNNLPASAQGSTVISVEFPLGTVRVREGVTLPCFLDDLLIPLLRAGLQLQVVMKLLELCYSLGTYNNAQKEILPFLENFPNEYPFLASPLTFHKGTIRNMALARNSYYQRMLEKVDNVLTKFEFGSQKASPYTVQCLFAKNHGRNLKHTDTVLDDSHVPIVMDEKDSDLHASVVDNEASSTADEFSYAEDLLETSESSSHNSFDEHSDSEQMPNDSMGFYPSYLSSLSFSFGFSAENSVQKLSKTEISENLSKVCEKTQGCYGMDSYLEGSNVKGSSFPQFGERNLLVNADHKPINSEPDVCLQVGCLPDSLSRVKTGNNNSTWFHITDSELEVRSRMFGGWRTGMLNCSDTVFPRNALKETTNNKHQHPDGNCPSSNSFCLQSWNSKYSTRFLSMNPTLSKGCFINSSDNFEERCLNYKEPLSYFDFTSVRDPRKYCQEKLASSFRLRYGFENSISTDTTADAAIITSDYYGKESCSNKNKEEKTKTFEVYLSSDSVMDRGEYALCANHTGGSNWETMLACVGNTSNITDIDYRKNSTAVFDIPLDYIIEKCLWEEILLQYRYVSKLTLKLLEEGFDLQEHLLALRRYHFMELADWADLFIMSLWHHKWNVMEADKRILEIQGVLELSVQRSSCEGDLNKDRLYVYMKGDSVMLLSASANGIHSFDFLGLGYRVGWPVSIILTPDALKIYSNIFNFLIQVKLAVFSLSDAWCSLKDLVKLSGRGYPSKRLKSTLRHISVLTETRYQVNHFITTLQQYVHSKLSHVSWCKFSNSLKHKVKDIMDFEAVHMDYLTESLNICFLSDETQAIANIIQSILQCAVDFRSCLVELPQIDIVQVLDIKKTFAKNLNDLFLCYLKSPKHVNKPGCGSKVTSTTKSSLNTTPTIGKRRRRRSSLGLSLLPERKWVDHKSHFVLTKITSCAISKEFSLLRVSRLGVYSSFDWDLQGPLDLEGYRPLQEDADEER
ncbi:hypothetical protein ACH5RR_021335 [Cinchona calisaya]|uniref:Gamma-tubulin complex component n=1 Tax=Cinchona calisaya TaxID=153742 RepID=A0ABD2ZH08_9GENT